MADAERALDLLNYKEIKTRPCRIMWSQRDPSLRKGGSGNIFIKNLDKGIDHKALYDTFATFGNILSCKVATDENGISRGFGFVHYDSDEAAAEAIKKVNGMLLNGKKAFVGSFIPRKDREKNSAYEPKWTNIFVKNLHKDIGEEKFVSIFSAFGRITSHLLQKDEEGKSKGFGFINYDTHEEAQRAIDEMNAREVEGQEIYVGKAQKKAEREKELRDMFEKLKRERMSKYQGVNLYVKNLDDTIDDEKLRQEFSHCGTITSAKVIRDEKDQSKSFGFVCFATPDEAAKAVTEMNGKMILNKPIYVALAQRKEQRRAQLEAQHAQRAGLRLQQQTLANPMYPPGAPVFFPQPGRTGFVYSTPMVSRGRFPGPQPRGFQPMPFPTPPGAPSAARVPARSTRGKMPTRIPESQLPGYGIKFNPNVRNSQQSGQLIGDMSLPSDHDKKNLIGERLYPLLQKTLENFKQGELAGKITGMLLESMDEPDLLVLLENQESLDKKISEALDVLEQHNMVPKIDDSTSS
jgi:polyadenylate-binding protein